MDVKSSFVHLLPGTGRSAPRTENRDYGFAMWSGTSFAAPRLAAEVARLRHMGESPDNAKRLATTAFPVPVAA